jgi:cyclic pyranopterin monophosphate synthase
MSDLTHFDQQGHSQMVDVGDKQPTLRVATASGLVRMKPQTLRRILERDIHKGDVLEVARLAAIMAAKRTSELIPLCHPLRLNSVRVEFSFPTVSEVYIEVSVSATERTGVEMEALAAVSIAGLTIYDMCKSIDREIVLTNIRLEAKTGGKSGDFHRTGIEKQMEVQS